MHITVFLGGRKNLVLKSISDLIMLGDESRIGSNEVDFGGEIF